MNTLTLRCIILAVIPQQMFTEMPYLPGDKSGIAVEVSEDGCYVAGTSFGTKHRPTRVEVSTQHVVELLPGVPIQCYPVDISPNGSMIIGSGIDVSGSNVGWMWNNGKLSYIPGARPYGFLGNELTGQSCAFIIGESSSSEFTVWILPSLTPIHLPPMNKFHFRAAAQGSRAWAGEWGIGPIPHTSLAAMFTRSTLLQTLPHLYPATPSAVVYDISPDGRYVCGAMSKPNLTGGSSTEAVLWIDRAPLPLTGHQPNFISVAMATSDDGIRVVGKHWAGGSPSHAVYWEGNQLFYISNVLSQDPVIWPTVQWWDLWEARECSGDGHTIIGLGYDNWNFKLRHWIARVN